MLKIEKNSRNTRGKEILYQLRKRLITTFLDLVILYRIEAISSSTGYAVRDHIYRKFNILLSPGTVYSALYSMEREGLVKGEWKGRKRVYHITPEGQEVRKIIEERIDMIRPLFWNLMSVDKNREPTLRSLVDQSFYYSERGSN